VKCSRTCGWEREERLHLLCFVPGQVGRGSRDGAAGGFTGDQRAQELTNSALVCAGSYDRRPRRCGYSRPRI